MIELLLRQRHDLAAEDTWKKRSNDETDDKWRWLEGDWLYPEDGQPRRLVEAVEGHADQEHLQDLRPGHGRADGGHGQRRRLLSRGLQEVIPGDGFGHAGGDHARVLRQVWLSRAPLVQFGANGSEWPADPSGLCRARGYSLSSHHVGRSV